MDGRTSISCRFNGEMTVLTPSCGRIPINHRTRIVRPDAKRPLVAADEVGMIIRNPQVVNGFPFFGITHVLDGNQLTIMTQQQIANLQSLRLHPTFLVFPEWMLQGCPNNLSANPQEQNPTPVYENFLDEFDLQLTARIRFRARQYLIAYPEFFNCLVASACMQ